MNIKVKKLDEHAVIPTYTTEGAVAFDLHALIDNPKQSIALMAGYEYMVKTGLAFEIPKGYEMQVRQRSGISVKYPNYIAIGTGTIDQDYRGEIMIPIVNNSYSKSVFYIYTGMRIAQAIIAPVKIAKFIEVGELDETKRGAGGFGHTGDYTRGTDGGKR